MSLSQTKTSGDVSLYLEVDEPLKKAMDVGYSMPAGGNDSLRRESLSGRGRREKKRRVPMRGLKNLTFQKSIKPEEVSLVLSLGRKSGS